MRDVFFDLETTGLGKANNIPFQEPVGIFNLGFAGTGGGTSSLYGTSSVKFEDNAFMRNLQKLNRKGISDAKNRGRTEADILKKFVGSLEEGDRLIGWNNLDFDSPVLVRRLRDLGLNDEATKVAGMKHIDMMHKVKGYMDRMLSEIPGAEGSPWGFGPGSMPKGMSQEAIAHGLGIQVSAAHTAGDDARVLQEISMHSKDYKSFKKRFTQGGGLRKWAEFVDASMDPSKRHTRYADVFTGRGGAIPSQEVAELVRRSNAPDAYTMSGGDLKQLDWSVEKAKAKAQDMSDVAASAAKRTPSAFETGFDKYFGKLNDLDVVKSAKVGAAIVAGSYVVKKAREFSSDRDQEVPADLRIDARELGKPAYEIVSDLKRAKSMKSLNAQIKAKYMTMKAGNVIGAQVAEEMSSLDGFIGTEVELEDKRLGVKGFADTVMRIDGEKRAIELKTIDQEDFRRLSGPKERHAMQANFYSHALGARMGHVMYINRQNPEERVTFDVPYDPGSLIASVEKYRGAVYTASQSGGYKTALEYFFGNKSGTRDQTSRNYFTGPGYARTPNPPNNSYVGSRNIQRNN